MNPSVSLSSFPISATSTGTVGCGGQQSIAQARRSKGADSASLAQTIPRSVFCRDGFAGALEWIHFNIPGTRPTLPSRETIEIAAGSLSMMSIPPEETGTAGSADKPEPPNSQRSLTLQTASLPPQSAPSKGTPADPSKADPDDAPAVATQAEIAKCIEQAVALFCEAQDLAAQVKELSEDLQKDVYQFLTTCLQKKLPEGKQEKAIIEEAGGVPEIASGILTANEIDVKDLRDGLQATAASATKAPKSDHSQKKVVLGLYITALTVGALGVLVVLVLLAMMAYAYFDWRTIFAPIRYAIADTLDHVKAICERLRGR